MNYLGCGSRNMRTLTIVFILTGLFSILYYVYDLIYPNHFVADMYGMEVMFRVAILLMVIFPLLFGMVLMKIGWNKKNSNIATTGNVIVIMSSLILVFMSARVFLGRHKDEIRKSYVHKSTNELIEIVLREKDQFAMYPIIERKDRAAVPALCEILLDENQDLNLRMIAADALGQIGGDMARNTLDKAIVQSRNSYLTDSIKYASEAIGRNENMEER